MSEKSWKRVERKVAELLGGRRVPVSGRSRGATPDVEHPILSIEVKSRKTLPAWVEEALEQAESSATEGKIPAVVLHRNYKRHVDSLVVVRLASFLELLKGEQK